MSSGARKDFDAWFSENYEELVKVAKTLHRDPRDLVHYTYLTTENALHNNPNILRNLPGYFHTAMWRQSTATFQRLYRIVDAPAYTHVSNYDLSDAIRKEEALLMADHLSWFDRTVLTLYLEGWSMAEVARESGVNVNTLYKSIEQSKKKLRDVIRRRTP